MSQKRGELRVLMFGWEYPPYKSGGLGTACFDLTKGLSRQGVEITFVMPFAPEDAKAKFVKLLGANVFKVRQVDSLLTPYMTSNSYSEAYSKSDKKTLYGQDIFQEVARYAKVARQIAKEEPHDLIHAHDWMTYQAGLAAREVSGKPLVVHLHATEFDRTGGSPNPLIAHLEYTGLKEADRVITNSNFSKANIIKHYKIPSEKIDVVHWGIDEIETGNYTSPIKKQNKIVLFLGRITVQKGPDYFIEVAKKVLEFEKNVTFVVAGGGDMLPRILQRAAELGIADKVVFTGPLTGEDVYKAFKTADIYVMPSISEPFGLVALESLKCGTPIIISKQSGVAEVLTHALKVDFWDINEMANKIVSALRYDALLEELRENSTREVRKFNIDEPAKKVLEIYKSVIRKN